jgi:hypothetical protein
VRDSAPAELGVGKNMAASIRHWGQVTGVLKPSIARGEVEATELGRKLFGQGGWDPFFEDSATAWLIHWHLANARERASTWWLAFSRLPESRFTRESLTDMIFNIANASPATRATRSSIKRDVDVFIRTYVVSKGAQNRSPEDSLDSPLVELGLIRSERNSFSGDEHFTLERDRRETLPDEILAYSILSFWDQVLGSQQTTSFESLCYREGSPGVSFRIAEGELARRLESSFQNYGLIFDDTAGMREIHRNPTIAGSDGFEFLDSYYRSRRSKDESF